MIVRKNEWLTFKAGRFPVKLFVRRWIPDAPNGCTVFFVHGLVCTGADATYIANQLSRRGYSVVSPDLAGHGHSTYLGRDEAYTMGLTALTLKALVARYAPAEEGRIFVGSSWGASILCLFLAATRLPVTAAVINDSALQWQPAPARDGTSFLSEVSLRFDSLEAAKEHLRRRDEEMFEHRDTDEIEPKVLDRYLASRFIEMDGKFAFAVDPCVVSSLRSLALSGKAYPDFYRIVTSINSRHVLLLFGQHSRFGRSAVRDRLAAECGNVTILDVERAGHSLRLLSPRHAGLILDYIDKARRG